MPNTFSMSSAYVRGYIAEHRLKPPDVDVIDMVLRKANKMCLPVSSARRGRAWSADARNPGDLAEGPARLVFTSPPYLGVIKYGKYNWIRLWMLGHEPRAVDDQLMATASLPRYLDFLAEVLSKLCDVVRADGYVCLMIGDVTDKSSGTTLNLAETVWCNTAKQMGWRRLGILNDHLPQQHKVSRIWGHGKKGQATKVDRILVLAPPGSSHRLPPRPRTFTWNNAHIWAQSPVEEV
jgi:site-specific DNA-methyltransferase (adenine-specific)